MYLPTEDDWKNIAQEFATRAHFPHCIGALDGKYIRVQKFPHSGSMNLNNKHYFSIELMAITDANLVYLAINGEFSIGL